MMKKRFFVSILAGMMTLAAAAQISTTLSPYSQFGMGVLSDQSLGFNRGMGGVAYGLRSGKFINMKNPASYSAVDSLTMLFDLGVAGQISNFKEGNKSRNTKTGNFDYAVASFRLLPHVGVAAGVVPFSNIGYSYYSQQNIGSSITVSQENHDGDGGFSQAFVGAGWELAKGFSVGFNISYFWGKYTKSIEIVSSDTYVNTVLRKYSGNASSYKLDIGAQWQRMVSKDDLLTVGMTASIGHRLKGDAELTTTNTNSMTSTVTSSLHTVEDAFSIPTTIGIGASVLHKNSLTAAFDYTYQHWSNIDYPAFNKSTYELVGGYFKNRHQVAAGVDWLPNPVGRKFLELVHYRMGVSYATPYYKIGSSNGPSELAVSAGFGIPLYNAWNNRSTLNITAQWVRFAAPNSIKENTFRVTLGLTFNERWFAKWKVD